MKRLVFFLSLIFLTGCSFFQQTTENNFAPQLLMQYPLPVITSSVYKLNFKIEMDLYIKEDGTVGKVKFVKSSGDKEWDSLAAESILKWKYSPARVDNHSINIWFHQSAVVEYQDPKYLFLSEIICPSLEEADTIYTALENGRNFDELAALQTLLYDHDRAGDLGKIDICLYPKNIRTELSYLEKDQYTKPLKYGDNYVIFKRK